MKLFASIEGDIRAMMKAELEAAERAVTAGVAEAASGLQTAWRGQITGAALGQSLANSVRTKLYPTSGTSIRAAAVGMASQNPFFARIKAPRSKASTTLEALE